MLKILHKTALVVVGTAIALPIVSLQPSLSQNPSLGDGIMCAAKGKTDKGTTIYLYTSIIDDASIKQKQPVSVTINEPMSEITEGEVFIIDKKTRTVTIDAFAAATAPQMQPVGLANTTYQGNNTFSGKTKAGTTVSFTLDKNYRVFQGKHGNQTFKGSCH